MFSDYPDPFRFINPARVPVLLRYKEYIIFGGIQTL